MTAPSRIRIAVAAAVLSAALIGCMTGTAIALEDADGKALPPRPSGAPATPADDAPNMVVPQTTPRTATHSK
jgi:hypothetical protein